MQKDDVIYRQDAIDAIFEAFSTGDEGADRYIAEKILADLPSAQPEIIRCKDCKHYQFANNRAFGMPVKMCEWFGFDDVDDYDFCSRAERKEKR